MSNSVALQNSQMTLGYGEYVVYRKSPGESISQATFEKIFDTINRFSPAQMIERNQIELCKERYQLLCAEVKTLDQTLEVAFIPRALYELIFLRKSITEDLKLHFNCHALNKNFQIAKRRLALGLSLDGFFLTQATIQAIDDDLKKRKCWHLCFFDDPGSNTDPYVRQIAFKMNKTIGKRLSLENKPCLTAQKISEWTEREIQWFKNYHLNFLTYIREWEASPWKAGLGIEWGNAGPSANFGAEVKEFSAAMPMGFRGDADAEIVRKAIALECSEQVQNSFILYRGGDIQEDMPYYKSDPSQAHSLSYGTGLFSGALYDAGATPFHYMRRKENDAYAVIIPFAELHTSPFFIPVTNALCQLSTCGEIHGRTKTWEGNQVIGGIQVDPWRIRTESSDRFDHLKSSLQREEFLRKFEAFKAKAVVLKTSDHER